MPVVICMSSQQAPGSISIVGLASIAGPDDTPIPAGTQQGDTVYAFFCGNDPTDIQLPSGYTQLASGTNPGYIIARRVYDITPPSQVDGGDAFDGCVLTISLRGVSSGSPEDVALPTVVSGSSSTPDPPSITTVTPGCLILGAVFIDDNTNLAVAPGNADVAYQQPGTNENVGLALFSQAAAGTYNFASFFLSTSEVWKAATVAVRPG